MKAYAETTFFDNTIAAVLAKLSCTNQNGEPQMDCMCVRGSQLQMLPCQAYGVIQVGRNASSSATTLTCPISRLAFDRMQALWTEALNVVARQSLCCHLRHKLVGLKLALCTRLL